MALRSVEHCLTAAARSAELGGVPATAEAVIASSAVANKKTSCRIGSLLCIRNRLRYQRRSPAFGALARCASLERGIGGPRRGPAEAEPRSCLLGSSRGYPRVFSMAH